MCAVRTIPEQVIEQLQNIGSTTVSNAIEQFDVRTRNEGFVSGRAARCMFPQFTPKIGYAVTASIRTSSTPIAGRYYYDRIDWWSYVQSMPAPRFLVVQDIDHMPGVGALFGKIHASIAVALQCVAYLSNGAVRDLPVMEASGLQVFAGSVAVSHAYAHITEFGEPVEIGGLRIKPGDLLHGDQHGVVSIPLSIASEIPKRAAEISEAEQQLIEFCQSKDFTLDRLAEYLRRLSKQTGIPGRDSR